ncbi:D-alanine--D-alanine ligase [Ferrimonas balearica DSM 9799]|uniref:D-alanine--D-alanine ligase n=1 Tax=Ferrimonas balearica (strain DSM 9799 / CCM 4581 / KCTC 23876 / PAT) TaxID=550540 RepID=E1SMK7_FERBD|nr:D-alanine--D-alanine ligase [Ferrimonas balearica]ADN74562.1 D-alanine--D-alanine ligase [Ferrimonas balearica DSM 9799]
MSEVVKQDKVAVLFGGTSAEREVSLRSGAAVLAGLQRGGVDAHPFDPAERSLDELKGFDRAFIVLHGRGGEDGTVQGALELMKIPYTGSRVLGCAVAMDKVRTKWLWAGLGLPTADFEVVDKESFSPNSAEDIMARLGSPVMVKPACEGSSIGMAKAEDAASLQKAIDTALQYDDTVLVEAWVHGPEFTVSILGEEALPAIRMETPNVFYDYEAKYQSQTTQYHCPAGLSDDDEQALRALALRAFKAVGASGWGRVDVMRDADGSWRLLEVNTVPGMTETSLVPKAANAVGVDFDTLVARILAASY